MPPDRDQPWQPDGPARPASGFLGLWGPPRLVTHRVAHAAWQGAPLRIAVIADPHVCRPWLSPARMAAITSQVAGLGADLIVLAGDFLPDRYLVCRHLTADAIMPLFAGLTAPLGVVAILGNHDWKDCRRARATGFSENSVVDAARDAGITLMRNASRAIDHAGRRFYLVAFDSQQPRGRGAPGHHDPDMAFADVPDGAPSILLAHEPDYFAEGDARAFLQISGHTHGGQITLFGHPPKVPSRFGARYAVGHVQEGGRHLIVSAGLGYSGLPVRAGVPPEITLIEVIQPTP